MGVGRDRRRLDALPPPEEERLLLLDAAGVLALDGVEQSRAPQEILDEVDAALDLSHTQNIGRMIRTHFPFSQFIVVSLKEGMFNNANVIFRTKFVDGLSTVSRTAPALKDKVTDEDKKEGGALGAAAQQRADKKKKSGKGGGRDAVVLAKENAVPL